MPVRITCPHCNRNLRLPEELYDGPAQCPRCGGGFGVNWTSPARARNSPKPAAAPAVPKPAVAREAPALRPCQFCRELIKAAAKRCPHCGKEQGPATGESP